MSDVTYDLDLLEKSRAKWERSRGVRSVYASLFREAMASATSRPVLEIGAGAGFLKELHPEVVTSDIVKTPYVERELSAYEIEKSGEQWGSIVAMDVLHHLRDPFQFFKSASGSLKPGGRLIMVEPAGNPFGRLFYGLCHQEPCRPEKLDEPYVFEPDDSDGNFANMGMGWALFRRDRIGVEQRLAALDLSVRSVRYRDLIAYPATGGLSRSQILPTCLLDLLLRIEGSLPQVVLRRAGLRMIIVLERVAD